jgi:arylformamidase
MSAAPLTPEQCERGYNNRAAVPDYGDYFTRWAADSAATRSALKTTLDVRYGKRPKETMDLFHAGGRRGLLVFIHGGYWRALDKSDFSYLARPYVAEGVDVAIVNYDLCPLVDIGTIIDECRNAVAWLLREGAAHGLNTDSVVISGDSAGGHLTAVLHATDWPALNVDAGVIRKAIKAGVSVSGVFDLEPLIHTSMNPDLRLNKDNAAAWSPVRMRPTLAVPLLIAVGAIETSEFIRQSQVQWEVWPGVRPATAGSTGPMMLEGCHHFSAMDCLADPRHPLFRETLQYFGR